jgi:hypothetical protein
MLFLCGSKNTTAIISIYSIKRLIFKTKKLSLLRGKDGVYI